jgi:hypothetical protein
MQSDCNKVTPGELEQSRGLLSATIGHERQPSRHSSLAARFESIFPGATCLAGAGPEGSEIWVPVELDDGWYGLPSFRFMGAAAHEPEIADNGVRYAAPGNMALANLLSHQELGTARIAGDHLHGVLRSAKDLGRVLALARLAGTEETLSWPERWGRAVQAVSPSYEKDLRSTAGNGLRLLLAHEGALEDARHAIDVGLLAGYGVTVDALKAIGERLLVDAIEPFERS